MQERLRLNIVFHLFFLVFFFCRCFPFLSDDTRGKVRKLVAFSRFPFQNIGAELIAGINGDEANLRSGPSVLLSVYWLTRSILFITHCPLTLMGIAVLF